MVENPKVGQRVWWLYISDGYCELIEGVVVVLDPIDAPLIWVREEWLGEEYEIWRERLYDSPQSAATALRKQAQELLLVAAKLEQEQETHDEVS